MNKKLYKKLILVQATYCFFVCVCRMHLFFLWCLWNIVSKFVNDFGSSTTEVGKYWITMFNVLRKDLYNWRAQNVNHYYRDFKAFNGMKRFTKTYVSFFNSRKCMGRWKIRPVLKLIYRWHFYSVLFNFDVPYLRPFHRVRHQSARLFKTLY